MNDSLDTLFGFAYQEKNSKDCQKYCDNIGPGDLYASSVNGPFKSLGVLTKEQSDTIDLFQLFDIASADQNALPGHAAESEKMVCFPM
jgi:hypothetical protein